MAHSDMWDVAHVKICICCVCVPRVVTRTGWSLTSTCLTFLVVPATSSVSPTRDSSSRETAVDKRDSREW